MRKRGVLTPFEALLVVMCILVAVSLPQRDSVFRASVLMGAIVVFIISICRGEIEDLNRPRD